MCSEKGLPNAVFVLLLNHCEDNFDFNRRFTHRNARLELCETEGKTLLHVAMANGQTHMAIELLDRKADPKIVSIEHNQRPGQTPLGHLISTRSEYNHMALCNLIESAWVKDNPTFLLRNAIIRPDINQNIFHSLCQNEQERAHDSPSQQISTMSKLIYHFRDISKDDPYLEREFKDLLNARMIVQTDMWTGEQTPLLLAVSSGFDAAIRVLCDNGADVLVRVDPDPEQEFLGFSVLHMIDISRDSEAWEANHKWRLNSLRRLGMPWIEIDSSLAAKMKLEFEKRTQRCLGELERLLGTTNEGREMLKRRKMVLAEKARVAAASGGNVV